MSNHSASMEITVNVHESVLSRKLVLWTSNWKDVIKYDLYVKFPRIFANDVQINAKFCCKNFQWCLPSISNTTPLCLGGRFFRGHAVYLAIAYTALAQRRAVKKTHSGNCRLVADRTFYDLYSSAELPIVGLWAVGVWLHVVALKTSSIFSRCHPGGGRTHAPAVQCRVRRGLSVLFWTGVNSQMTDVCIDPLSKLRCDCESTKLRHGSDGLILVTMQVAVCL